MPYEFLDYVFDETAGRRPVQKAKKQLRWRWRQEMRVLEVLLDRAVKDSSDRLVLSEELLCKVWTNRNSQAGIGAVYTALDRLKKMFAAIDDRPIIDSKGQDGYGINTDITVTRLPALPLSVCPHRRSVAISQDSTKEHAVVANESGGIKENATLGEALSPRSIDVSGTVQALGILYREHADPKVQEALFAIFVDPADPGYEGLSNEQCRVLNKFLNLIGDLATTPSVDDASIKKQYGSKLLAWKTLRTLQKLETAKALLRTNPKLTPKEADEQAERDVEACSADVVYRKWTK